VGQTPEADATVIGIRKEIKDSEVEIKLEYSPAKVRNNEQFVNCPGSFLMSEYDKQSKIKQK
jgi:hypothetical protein